MASAVYFGVAEDTDSQTQTHRCSADAFKLEGFSLYLLKVLKLYSHRTDTWKGEREPVMNHHFSFWFLTLPTNGPKGQTPAGPTWQAQQYLLMRLGARLKPLRSSFRSCCGADIFESSSESIACIGVCTIKTCLSPMSLRDASFMIIKKKCWMMSHPAWMRKKSIQSTKRKSNCGKLSEGRGLKFHNRWSLRTETSPLPYCERIIRPKVATGSWSNRTLHGWKVAGRAEEEVAWQLWQPGNPKVLQLSRTGGHANTILGVPLRHNGL